MAKNCKNVLAHGQCNNRTCPFEHKILICDSCDYVAPHKDAWKTHLEGKKHRDIVSGKAKTSHCNICQRNIAGGPQQWSAHVASQKHRELAATQQVDADVEPQDGASTEKQEFCSLCQVSVWKSAWSRHLERPGHVEREKHKVALDEAEKDKNGISVEGGFNFGIVDPTTAGNGIQSTVTVTTSLPSSRTILAEANMASSYNRRDAFSRFYGFYVSVDGIRIPRNVVSGRPITVRVTFRQNHVGRYEDRLELVFEDVQLKKRFTISRAVSAIVGNKVDHEALKPKAPYVPNIRADRSPVTNVIEGVAPPSTAAIRFIGRLPAAQIPRGLLSVLRGPEGVRQQILHIQRAFLPSNVNGDTYGRLFKQLLWIEEFKMEYDLARYDIFNSTLSRHNSYYYLPVPGLAEKRPSVLVGDRILVQEVDAPEGRWYEGYVHVVRQAEVGLRFHTSFGWSPTQRYHIRFKLNRIPVKRQHQAMDTVFTEDRVLFPVSKHILNPRAKEMRIELFNLLIKDNPAQLRAVNCIVNQRAGSPPFVIFGPPGTGKTITMVESILQLVHNLPKARILACAPSNSAADLITERLAADLNSDELFRVVAASRFKDQIPDAVKPFTFALPNGHFSVPAMAKMKSFKVIVTTCVSAAILSGIGMPRGHFCRIFIDEAGQATEPEAFVSIKMLADSATNIILSGDPKQLGPVIRSGIARALGLETSYLERLMRREAYAAKEANGVTGVKLVKNFRSHDAILKFPNDRFYGGDLQPCANPTTSDVYLASSILPNPKFPVIFHSVSGKDDREASSPSFFNIEEVLQVKDYVQRLRFDRHFLTTDKDIGIITPYHAQCLKLRSSLRAVADGVKVGSVEEFQGQERRVIIISTVRSSREFVEYDLRHTLGFVASPRRFNVAVTRAQALLIVVGDPHVLSLDPLWRSFLNYVHLNGGWTGPNIAWDPTTPVDEAGGYDRAIRAAARLDMNDLTRRMEEATLDTLDGEGEEDPDANVDRPWRNVE